MSFPVGSKIQVHEKAKRRRNATRGMRCAKGTIPQVPHQEIAPEAGARETWFDKLRGLLRWFAGIVGIRLKPGG
ncbi:hypothetical protein LCGC14_0971480 [marine sediment metagenome]|uniref:Uncharacterized protein n=1 Tax=marine sediment metagenome TaxID=412755 RepID=A0A0F9QUR8_9ZZZZ